ncbi:YfiR family protein [Allosphingosinicella indica]|uniref:YfiR family protein n=1 Tax=Allosphingosinicella indica TaxID=941907 RepID=A0A1X7G926_9SPHN|nr:YfiR family protein [Allosphingosinicella indica]SMF66139.1 protein of unknown function [Allosphingosinicella indica]
MACRTALTRLLAALLIAGAAAPAGAQLRDDRVTAGFLPKLAHYVEWPEGARPGAGEPMTLCVLGIDPFGPILEQAARRQAVLGHRLAVRHLQDAGRAEGCAMAYVQGSSGRTTAAMLAALKGKPVLTVTDARFGEVRGMVHFAVQNGRVGFHIDDQAAADAGLGISSRLLGIARSVRQRGP